MKIKRNVNLLSRENGIAVYGPTDGDLLYRTQAVEFRAVDDGRVELSFSSELPVPMWGGDVEVMLHDPDSADLSRLMEVGAVLKNHDPRVIVGAPENARIDDDRKGRLTLRWGTTEDARTAKQEVVTDKSLRGVSIGWQPMQWMYFEEDGEFRGRKYAKGTWLATKWQALEVSLTPVPADWSVGVGRSAAAGTQPGANRTGNPKEGEDSMKKRIKLLTAWESPDGQRHAVGAVLELDAVVADGLVKDKIAAAVAERTEPETTPAPEHTADPQTREAKPSVAPGVSPETVTQAIAAERSRIAACRKIAKKSNAETPAVLELIEAGATPEQVRETVLEIVLERANHPTAQRVEVTVDGRESFARAAIVGIAIRSGHRNLLTDEERKLGGTEVAGFSLLDLAKDCLVRSGMAVRGSKDEIIRLALRGPALSSDMLARHSETITVGTSDFPFILANVANKAMIGGAQAVVVTWPLWCREGTASDFKAMSRLKLSEAGELPEVPEGSGYDKTKFSEQRELIQLLTFGSVFSLTRQAIINDDLNAFTGIPFALGNAAAYKPNILAVKVLLANGNLADGVALFATDRGNLSSAAAYLLTTSVDTARAGIGNLWKTLGLVSAMKHGDLSAEVGIYNSAQLKTVLTPMTGHLNALAALSATTYATGVEGTNPLAKLGLQVVAEPLLENELITGYSTKKYYGFADPRLAPVIEVAFLDGRREPYMEEIENVGSAADGRTWKVRIDCVAGAVDSLGAVREDAT